MQNDIQRIIDAALAEDIGAADITSQLLVPEELRAEMHFIARESLVACGLEVVRQVFATVLPLPPGEGRGEGGSLTRLDFVSPPSPGGRGKSLVECTANMKDGQRVKAGERMMNVRGPAQAILAGERVALNLLQRMSSVATMTAKYVETVKGTKAVILDTRKTMPTLRALDKYAVRVGGGRNHRMGLYDMVLIKDNHIALCGGVKAAVERARAGVGSGEVARWRGGEAQSVEDSSPLGGEPARRSRAVGGNDNSDTPHASRFVFDSRSAAPPQGGSENDSHAREGIQILIECDTLAQVKEALAARPDRILLDNMDVKTLREAVALVGGKIPLEASGNVTLDTVRMIAETGVDFISVGRLTHSVPSVDIGLDVAMG